MTLEERAKAFREGHKYNITPYRDGHPATFTRALLAELDYAKKNPPRAFTGNGIWEKGFAVGYNNALAHVRSLLKEPEGEK